MPTVAAATAKTMVDQRFLSTSEADLGVASGNGKGQIFVRGEVIKTVPESEIVATLIEEANRIAATMDPNLVGSPQVLVSNPDK